MTVQERGCELVVDVLVNRGEGEWDRAGRSPHVERQREHEHAHRRRAVASDVSTPAPLDSRSGRVNDGPRARRGAGNGHRSTREPHSLTRPRPRGSKISSVSEAGLGDTTRKASGGSVGRRERPNHRRRDSNFRPEQPRQRQNDGKAGDTAGEQRNGLPAAHRRTGGPPVGRRPRRGREPLGLGVPLTGGAARGRELRETRTSRP